MIAFDEKVRIQKEVVLGLIPPREDNREEQVYREAIAKDLRNMPKGQVFGFAPDWDSGYE